MKSKPFLWYPVLLFLAIFLFDKIFFLDKVRDYVKQEFTYIYYDVKKELLREIVSKYGSDGEYSKNPEKKKNL
ncbi:PF07611 domain protein [Leptospira weilii str. Ecochallenge]|uniref:PF07611 domain protein n=2 Tax=Leptospira weilii TaxID=28184 RepID=N1U643_9LEPT|nr:PF07611 domain protein [Leptospira weilii str. 2006001855]EMY13626.1 PF07611 domain protein [Leptospira weilii str. Ecochallenge]